MHEFYFSLSMLMMKDPKSAFIYNTIWSAKIDLVRQVWMHDVTNSLNQLLKNERQLYILNAKLRTVHLYIDWGTANINRAFIHFTHVYP